MEINEFLSFTREYMNEHGLADWNLATDRAVRRNGCCIYRTKTLSFSEHYIRNNPQSMLLNTVIHEIAHALTPRQGHSETWRRKCEELGYPNPTRCTKSEMPKGRYQGNCSKCGLIESYMHRKTDSTYRHRACGAHLVYIDTQKASTIAADLSG